MQFPSAVDGINHECIIHSRYDFNLSFVLCFPRRLITIKKCLNLGNFYCIFMRNIHKYSCNSTFPTMRLRANIFPIMWFYAIVLVFHSICCDVVHCNTTLIELARFSCTFFLLITEINIYDI